MLRPLADKVLVKPSNPEEMTRGGIFLPDTAKKRPHEGEVIAVGQGRMLPSGERVAPEVKVGDTVIFAEYAGTYVYIDNVQHVIVDETGILAVKEKK